MRRTLIFLLFRRGPSPRTPSYTSGTPGVYSYLFNTTAVDPCGGGVAGCIGFPTSSSVNNTVSQGGNMAIAAQTGTNEQYGTLWATIRSAGSSDPGYGELWGYGLNSQSTSLFSSGPIFDPVILASNQPNCPTVSNAPASWVAPSFADPTVVNGMVFVALGSGFSTTSADIVGSPPTVLSGGGVLVFGSCK